MPAKGKGARSARSAEKAARHRNRVPLQPDGQPQGKHMSGFKGMKSEIPCLCGGCHPNAKRNLGKVIA